MKKVLAGLLLMLTATAANADFFGGNDGEWKMGPNGPYWDESNWPQWTPMYWMEEMMDNFGDDDNSFGNFGGFNPMNRGNNFSQFGQQPYPMMPNGNYAMPNMNGGYAMPMPQAPIAPMAPAPSKPAAPVQN